jgi:type I restriction enzyme, S subunit
VEVRPGYKLTEVGVIPDDWDCLPICDLARLESGHTPSRTVNAYWSGPIPWVSLHDTNSLDQNYIYDTALTITQQGIDNSSARLLPAGTVVFSRTATVGKAAILGCAMATSQDFANYVCGPKLCNLFVVYLFRGMARTWASLMAGSTHKTIYMPTFEKLRIPVPSVSEQESIAGALADVDHLLDGLDRLIVKKRDLKRAAMQQLLTGQARLPDSSGEWEVKAIRDIVSMPITDGPHLTPKFLTDGIPFLSVNNLVNNRIDLQSLRFISKADHLEFSKKCKPRKGDILFGKAASVGMVALIETDMELNIWSPLALIRVASPASARFVCYALQASHVHRQIGLLTNSSSQGNIGMGEIGLLEIPLPGPDEQTEIAAALSDMDAELAALEARRDKTRDLKRAMMQELLTGRTRLVPAGAAAHA